ncbi:hypothetical protein [Streptomyces sp. NPDC002758]
MNTTRRDGRDDTGEQDVRELRHRFAGEHSAPTGIPNEPHVRHKEDVPHEGSIPDFYGLGEEDDGIDEELSALVDAGELCMGWDSDTEEIIYWLPQETPLAEEPEPAPKRPSRRAHKTPRKHAALYRRAVLTLVASIAPFFVGMTAEAAMDMHAERTHPMDQPDMVGNEVPTPTPTAAATDTPLDAEGTVDTSDYRPTGSSYALAARHAKATTYPTTEKPGTYVGKHRKAHGKPTKVRPKASKKTESKPPRSHDGNPHRPRAVPPKHSEQKPHTPAETVVVDILGPVQSLLG